MNNKAAIQSAQLRQLLSVSNVSLLTSVSLAVFLGYVQSPVIPAASLWLWAGLMALGTLFRAATIVGYQRHPVYDDPAVVERRLYMFRIGVAVAGLAWATGSFLLFPPDQPQYQMFLIFMMLGLTAGGVVSFSSDFASALLFVGAVISGVMLREFTLEGGISFVMGMASLLYLGFMVLALRRINGHILDNIGLRLEASAREESLRVSRERYRSLLADLPVGVLHYDPDLVITYCNERFARTLRNTPERLIGLDMKKLNDQSILPALWTPLQGKSGCYEGRYRATLSDVELWIELSTSPHLGENGKIEGGIAIVQDVTARMEAEEQIHQLAFYDPLTLLPNRRLLMDRLNHAIAVGSRVAQSGALLFIDLDNFKVLNDTRGHVVGDLLLVEVARRLLACVREGDTVGRLGGDEFVVIIENLNGTPEQAGVQVELVGEKIRERLGEPYRLGEIEHHCTASIGISLFRDHAGEVENLLRRADTAMYGAKTAGRNAVCFFDPAMQARLESRVALEAELRRALPQGQFELHYQMQVDGEGRAIGAEALLRWRHPERGLVSPLEFIPLAEESGQIVPIGLWVLEEACARIRAWESRPATGALQIAVNVSASQFHRPDFVQQVCDVIARSGIAAGRLKLELTETVVLDNVEDTVAKMHELKQLGVHFSLDDFGTGYSSLSYLTRLPLDQLKIDRSFVRNIGVQSTDDAIVRAVIDMGRSLGMEVIAEGVETPDQRDFLARHGCRAYQGFLFARPLPAGEFEARLAAA